MKTRERLLGIGQVMTMRLFFEMTPRWLQVIARGNPLSDLVETLRTLMITGAESRFGLGIDFAMMLAVLLVFVIVAARLDPTMVR